MVGVFNLPPSPLSPSSVSWCELKRDRDFFAWREPVDWIITNPPWSQLRAFLQHAMRISDHVVFLVTINHIWTRARIRDIRHAGFGLREIVMVDMPRSFPQLGFQLGAVHLERGWGGALTLTDWCHVSVDTGASRSTLCAEPFLPRPPAVCALTPATHPAAAEPHRFTDDDLALARRWIPELLRKYPLPAA